MCVQCVGKSSRTPAIFTIIEKFIEENNQTLLPPWLLLERIRIRNDEIFQLTAIVTTMDFFLLKENINTNTFIKMKLNLYINCCNPSGYVFFQESLYSNSKTIDRDHKSGLLICPGTSQLFRASTLVGEGSVINGAYPIQFFSIHVVRTRPTPHQKTPL